VAGGERDLPPEPGALGGAGARAAVDAALVGEPPAEFRPVFDGFRQMAADLDASRAELGRAQRVLAWGEMARQVAHEIKNPLTPIRLGVQHLRRAWRDGRIDFGDILERNVERVLAEIDRLDEIARAFSRYGTAPDRREPPEPVDVAVLARDVVALERMGQGSLRWEIAGTDAPAWAMARDGELREVLLNLLENARLANARCVCVCVVAPGGDTVTLRVDDDGDGIDAEALPRIFEPHFSTRTSGSGLGLAISRRLVEAWGGAITAESARGVGTTMRITLRATTPAPAGAGAPDGDAALGRRDGAG
jgi:signal transduction histidine kinase